MNLFRGWYVWVWVYILYLNKKTLRNLCSYHILQKYLKCIKNIPNIQRSIEYRPDIVHGDINKWYWWLVLCKFEFKFVSTTFFLILDKLFYTWINNTTVWAYHKFGRRETTWDPSPPHVSVYNLYKYISIYKRFNLYILLIMTYL